MANFSNTPRPAYVYDTATNEWVPVGVGAHSHNEIPKTVVDAKGDLIVGTAADTVDRLAVGTNGYTLVADSAETTGLKYVPRTSFIGCILYDSGSTQSIPNGIKTAVTFNAETIDTNGFHSTSTNTSRVTIPSGFAGKYQITIQNIWDKNANGLRSFSITKNGSEVIYSPDINGNSNYYVGNAMTVILDLAVGDYIEYYAYQTSGGALNLYKRTYECPFQVEFLGA